MKTFHLGCALLVGALILPFVSQAEPPKDLGKRAQGYALKFLEPKSKSPNYVHPKIMEASIYKVNIVNERTGALSKRFEWRVILKVQEMGTLSVWFDKKGRFKRVVAAVPTLEDPDSDNRFSEDIPFAEYAPGVLILSFSEKIKDFGVVYNFLKQTFEKNYRLENLSWTKDVKSFTVVFDLHQPTLTEIEKRDSLKQLEGFCTPRLAYYFTKKHPDLKTVWTKEK